MSSQKYIDTMTNDKQEDIMFNLYMKGVNHDGHSWVTFGDVEDAIADILLAERKRQVPILERIRAEINELTVFYTTKDKGTNLISQRAVNRIFDKYKTE